MIIAWVRLPHTEPVTTDMVLRYLSTRRRLVGERPGLLSLLYFVSDDGMSSGGAHVFRTRAQGEEFFDDEWWSGATRAFNLEPEIDWFDCPVIVDNKFGEVLAGSQGSQPVDDDARQLRSSWGPFDRAEQPQPIGDAGLCLGMVRFTPSTPSAEEMAQRLVEGSRMVNSSEGLIRSFFVSSPADRSAGAIHLWETPAQAAAYYDDSWRDRLQLAMGATPTVELLSCPVAIDFHNGEVLAGHLD